MTTTYQRTAIYNADDIRAIADHAGSYFFTPETMRFFSSRVLSDAWQVDGYETKPGRRYVFVTSEKHGDDTPRHYAVRLATLGTVRDDRPAIDIETVGDYHDTARAAKRAAQALADELRYGS